MDMTEGVSDISAGPREEDTEATRVVVREPRENPTPDADLEHVFDVDGLSVYYADFRAVRDVTLPIYRNEITALIGPSGCGKTTFIRCLNRMNDLIEGARVEGTLLYHGVDL